MPTRIDCEHEVLGAAGYAGTLPERELAWLHANGGTGGTLADAWESFLTARGIPGPGATLDRRFAWLKAYPAPVGTQATFLDAWRAFWCERGSAVP